MAFKQKRPADGLESMLTATLLEPKVSLYQSYLGKSYYQLQRFPEGLAAIASAKRLDPRDPTPWLYESLFLRDQNRQVDALASLRQSIARNDNRAVYRSRLLLDRDEATRNVSLAQLYRQLGFEAWGAFEAVKSLDADLTNASAHLFLAETYGTLPDRTQATASALLQHFLYAPVNRNSFNNFSEYTALLDQPLRQLSLVPAVGSDGYWSGTVVTRSGNDRLAHYAFIEQIGEDGPRTSRADARTTVFAQGKLSITERDSLFASLVDVSRNDGQSPSVARIFGSGTLTPISLRQYSSDLDTNLTSRFDTTEAVVGYEHTWRPGSSLTAAAQVEQLTALDTNPDDTVTCSGFNLTLLPDTAGLRSSTRFTYPFERRTFQGQHTVRAGRHQLIGGTLVFEQEKERRCDERIYDAASNATFVENSDEVVRQQDHLYRGYLRDEIELSPTVHATLGVVYDDVRYGAPGDPARVDDLTRWSPQGALSFRLGDTVVRAAGFRSVSGDFLGSKIAPVTVGGFPLERNELPTTVRDEANVSVERAWARVFASGQVFVRDAEVPALRLEGLVLPDAETRTRGGTALANWIMSTRWAGFAENYFSSTRTLLYTRTDNVARAGVSFVHPRGLIARLAGSYFTQRFSDEIPDLPRGGYFLADVDVSYEFARKRGLLSLRVNNLLDRQFTSAIEGLSLQQLRPDRRAYATLRWRI